MNPQQNPIIPTPQQPPQNPTPINDAQPVPMQSQNPAAQMQPQAFSQSLNSEPAPPTNHHTNASNIVLQWLTYAFWGWTVLIMSFLTAAVLSNLLGDFESNSFIIYAVAAILVLLPLSIGCDIFYSKQEPKKKTGAASIVMVIHAVIFALFGIGALIGAVFSVVSMLTTSSSDTTGNQVALFSSVIIFILYAVTFLRVLNPSKFSWIRRAFVIFMTVAVGAVALSGILGPAAHERATRTDRLIDNNLYSLSSKIDNHARENDSLPDSLNELTLDGDVKKVVDDNLVEYKPNSKPASIESNDSFGGSYSSSTIYSSRKTFYYELCVEYKKEKKDKYSSYYNEQADKDGYSDYISTSSHPAGEKCYKLKTTDY